ncbi:MAG TPA: hypothetical protein PK696_09185 [bacterium]|nr:hypothetical protein [bacterium]HQM53053.1 hypothetical protein [bacterium]
MRVLRQSRAATGERKKRIVLACESRPQRRNMTSAAGTHHARRPTFVPRSRPHAAARNHPVATHPAPRAAFAAHEAGDALSGRR